jgi:RNA-directed DNA polymerase
MLREQKTEKSDCPCEGMVETESNKGVRSITSLDNADKDGATDLLEKVLERDNLNKAYKR